MKSKITMEIDRDRVPAHVGFIMDGNGRWAKLRGMARTLGHKEGYKRTMDAVSHCADLGIKVVSFYAFSTENWNRPKDEIDSIFKIVRENLEKDTTKFLKNGIRLITSGDIKRFPADLRNQLEKTVRATKSCSKMTLNFCINYGGRAEITRVVNRAIEDWESGHNSTCVGKIPNYQEADIEKFLYTAGLPNLDLLIRTGGEQRISNFMLWQAAYAELMFIPEYWPDINGKIIDRCIIEYQGRDRRFGAIKEEAK